ncbi:MAG: hypothetical protein ABIQ39_07325 [Ilumatobacteraceae bacterium]
MTVLGIATTFVGRFISEGGHDIGVDSDGHITTASTILPDKAELIYGSLASIIIFVALWKFGGPPIAKAMQARTARIQKELDEAAAAKSAAATEATEIRLAKGDIAAERARILGEAQAQAETMLAEGRARLEVEITELQAKSAADIVAAHGRVGDELRAEITRLSSAAVDHVVSGTLDAQTHQRLIEDFITRVGAGVVHGANA